MKSVTSNALVLLGLLSTATLQGHAQTPDEPVAGNGRPLGEGIRCVAFSPDGTMLAATFGEPKQRGRVVLWKMEDQKQLWTYLADDGVPTVAFAPNGKTMAIGGYDHIAKLLDTQTGKVLKVFAEHTNYVRAVAIAPDNKTLATASWDGTVKTWDLTTGAVRQTLQLPNKNVFMMAYSPSGKWLMASDPNCRIWDVATGEEKAVKDVDKFRPGWAVFTDDNSFIARCDNGTIRRWNIESGQQDVLFKKYASRMAFSAKARLLAISTGERAIDLLDYPPRIPTQQEKDSIQALLAQLDHDNYETREAASKEFLTIGMLAEPELRRAMKETSSVEVRIRCRRLLEEILAKPHAKLSGKTGDVEALAFSPDGQLFAGAGKSGAVCIWKINDVKELMRLTPVSP
jgi:WD40 repeat protein